MSAPSPPALPTFPDAPEYARALFEEAARHLEDARVLHGASRYAAGISSSAKAAELGVKCVLVLDRAMGWWDGHLAVRHPAGLEVEHGYSAFLDQ